MQVAIVTGASSGIGFGCATTLAAAGMAVLGIGRDADRLADLERRLPARAPGSPAGLPVYEDGRTVRFTSLEDVLEEPTGEWGETKLVYLQHNSDPVSFFSGHLALSSPEWLADGQRGPDVSDEMGWFPLVTMWQVALDLPVAGNVPAGHGHLYTSGEYLSAWVGITEPEGWTDADFERLEPIRQARVPLHLALGNHDARETFRAAFHAEKPPADTLVDDHHVGVVNAAGLRLIVLDSLVRPNSTPGTLGDAQRGWLAKALDAEATKPTLVFVHHNPAVGNAGALQDAQELLDLLAPRRQVKALVFGHTHVWDVSNREGLYLVNLPAVAYPFNASQPLGWCRLTPNDGGATLELRPLGAKEFRDRHDLRWRAG